MDSSLESYERIALVFQGGGALGAYHIGVYRALSEKNVIPNFFVGISIGAFTAAILAGNHPENRLERLKSFWDHISWPEMPKTSSVFDHMRTIQTKIASLQGVLFGQPNFFIPRFPGPALQPRGTIAATSYYDTSRLKTTLLSHIDFTLLNSKKVRLILGATRVCDGKAVFFDNATTKILPEHIMASGAMPPGFPGVKIDGDLYWDGGCVANTPLECLYALTPKANTLSFIVDLFNPQGEEPRDMDEVYSRSRDILYANRTESHINHLKDKHILSNLLFQMLSHTKAGFEKTTEFSVMKKHANKTYFDVIHLMYDVKRHEERIKMYEFSKTSIKAREEIGCQDMTKTINELSSILEHNTQDEKFRYHKFLAGERC